MTATDPVGILLVEDSDGDARLIEIMLAGEGARFRLERAADLSSALARLEREGVDIILLDLGLPDSTGLDTFLRVQVRVPWIPIVVMSGLDDEEVALLAVQQGAQDYLVKGGLTDRTLGRSLSYAIQRKRNEDELVRTRRR